MSLGDNIVKLDRARASARCELLDDISARAFLLMREEAEDQGLPLKDLIERHLAGIAEVVSAVEGPDQARRLLHRAGAALPAD